MVSHTREDGTSGAVLDGEYVEEGNEGRMREKNEEEDDAGGRERGRSLRGDGLERVEWVNVR